MLGLSLSKRLKNTLTWLLLKEVALKLSPGFSVWGVRVLACCGGVHVGFIRVVSHFCVRLHMSIINTHTKRQV